MNINKIDYKWNGSLSKREATNKIILHHMASDGTAEDIHRIHLNNGWSGIGYHFFVRLNGEIYEGRPIDKVGAHIVGQNAHSIGVCFEGNYENRTIMPYEQLQAGRELLEYLKNKYPKATIGKHKDFQSTACPGKYFPFDEIVMENASLKDQNSKESAVYNWVPVCPEWSQPYVQKAWDLGWIKGDNNGNLNLTDTKIFTLVVLLRALNIME